MQLIKKASAVSDSEGFSQGVARALTISKSGCSRSYTYVTCVNLFTWCANCRSGTPPTGEPNKREIRPREMTPEQSAQAKQEGRVRDEFMSLSRLPENHRQSHDELCRLAEDPVKAV
jgi:hypothetical protein